MLISLDKRFIFVKGVKVAGSSIELHVAPHLEESAVVTPMGSSGRDADSFGMRWRPRNWQNAHGLPDFYDHMPANQIRSVIGSWLYESMFKFGIIRNPFEKVRSLFFMNRLVRGEEYTLQTAIDSCPSEKVNLCDGDSIIVHRLVEYERLNEELTEIFSLHSIPFEGRLNIFARSKPRTILQHIDTTFSKDQIDMIREKFAFEFFHYDRRHVSFEPNP
jgi:hypothetical protein